MRFDWSTAAFLVLPSAALLLAVARPVSIRNTRSSSDSVVVIDGRGQAVAIKRSSPRIIPYSGIVMPDYVLVTGRPETLLDTFAFESRTARPTLLNKIFPKLKSVPELLYGHQESIEEMLIQRPTAVLTWAFLAPELEEAGLPAVGLRTANDNDMLGRSEIYGAVSFRSVEAAATQQAYKAHLGELQRELGPEQIKHQRSIMMLIENGGILSAPDSHALAWLRAGLREAQPKGLSGEINAEAVLAIDPDIIVVTGALTSRALIEQSGFRDLRAMRESRVYKLPRGIATIAWNIVDLPFYSRWLAELAYPERLRPTIRAQLSAAYATELGYQCTEDDLDWALAVDENQGTANYDRFAQQH